MQGLLGDLNIFSKIDIKRLEKVLLVNFLSNKIIIDYFLIKKLKLIILFTYQAEQHLNQICVGELLYFKSSNKNDD